MATRMRRKTVLFKQPFRLGEPGGLFQAGAYPIDIDEELVQGLPFPAYRRTAITMHLIADPRHPGMTECIVVDPLRLDTALARDSARSSMVAIDEMLKPSRPTHWMTAHRSRPS